MADTSKDTSSSADVAELAPAASGPLVYGAVQYRTVTYGGHRAILGMSRVGDSCVATADATATETTAVQE